MTTTKKEGKSGHPRKSRSVIFRIRRAVARWIAPVNFLVEEEELVYPPPYTLATPQYTSSEDPSNFDVHVRSSAESESSTSTAVTPDIRTAGTLTNLLTITSEGNISGAWRVDPSIEVPHTLTNPRVSASQNSPRNLDLWSTKGSIDARIDVVSNDDSDAHMKCVMLIESEEGTIIHLTREKADGCRIFLDAKSKGPITVYIPRSFTGPIRTLHPTWNGLLSWDSQVEPAVMTFKERAYPRSSHYFHGDYASSGYVGWKEWDGDYLIVGSGSDSPVKILYTEDSEGCH
ncbi:hypothetical protein SISNIDRAFT_470130 [Sistotremastrum niveocremeum HHB9708]|uniref:DUF7330 domain-containing protein n=2 Tax=Sistotremastraceae TaxID=3402574 RepID=A0A164PA49_9AGAM|nr:hypothetical protein SISNIDRAFT_470130 [Sistotremastrum niveocremeum HHB9708]KZT34118.1 hypothetical protein SISSUDRAFT_1036542 [Sistotremastrum suecicum HHB10207 ss-3]